MDSPIRSFQQQCFHTEILLYHLSLDLVVSILTALYFTYPLDEQACPCRLVVSSTFPNHVGHVCCWSSRCCCFSNYFTATATNMKCTAPSTCFPYSCCSVVSTFHCMCCDPVLLLIVVAVAWFYFSL